MTALLPDPLQPANLSVTAAHPCLRSCTLVVSRSRTHDAVLDILKAYKLSGNFHGNLETVLKDMGVFGLITYRIKAAPALAFPDRRHVEFTGDEGIQNDVFDGIVASINARIGIEAPWWGRLLRGLHPAAADAAPRRTHR